MDKVAIIGTGQTITRKKRRDVVLPELMREAVNKALEDADIELKEIDAIVYGGSPELFGGVNHPEKWATDTLHGGTKIPVIRTHTGGTVGASTGIFAFYLAASGMYGTVIAVSGDKLTETSVQEGLGYVFAPLERGLSAGAPSAVALQARRYMHLYPAVTEEHMALIGLKARKNAVNNPFASLYLPTITYEMIFSQPYLSSPIKLLDSCPTTDGACAMVLQTGSLAKKRKQPMSWIQGCSSVAEGALYPGRELAHPIALHRASENLYKKTGISKPLEQLDVVELYDAFTIQELIWSDGLKLAEPGRSYELLEKKVTYMEGSLPINPSGGVVSNNTIGASALIRQAEIACQIMGKAGQRQIEKADLGLAHGWGGVIQFHTLMLQSKSEDLKF